MSKPSQTVFVVDDDADMRHSLELLLAELGFAVRSFASATEFESHYDGTQPGCLIVDLQMPRKTGLELYEQMIDAGMYLPTIFITAHADVHSAVAAMKHGALEFLEKPFERAVLIERVGNALRLDAQRRAKEASFSSLAERLQRLSARERETLELVVAGEPNKAIAARLYISERAVEMRRANMMRKLNVRTVAELLDLTITHRILSNLRNSR